MVQHEFEILPGIVILKIEFSLDKPRISQGERTILRWNAEGADEAVLWISAVSPLTPEPLDWVRIGQMGERVDLAGEMEIAPDETTAYYLVVKTPRGLQGVKEVAEVAEAEEPKREPEQWQPQRAFLERMVDRPHILRVRPTPEPRLLGDLLSQQAHWYSAQEWFASPPAIWLSVSSGGPQVIYADETFGCSYSVTNASCIHHWCGSDGPRIEVNTSKISGTELKGGFSTTAYGPPCGMLPAGKLGIIGSAWKPSHVFLALTASNASGKSVSADVRVDVISVPKFKGAVTDKRRGDIRQAAKDIEGKLNSGCIINNAALDQSVSAFQKGHLKRSEFGYRLTAEILCMGNITFLCNDVGDAQWGAGHWLEHTNEIVLEWSPKYIPYLEYVILHELVHKCGFNSELYKYGYNRAEIEDQARTLSGACYP